MLPPVLKTKLIEELVHCAVLSHFIEGFPPVSILLLAAPESGKSQITSTLKEVPVLADLTGKGVGFLLDAGYRTAILNDMSYIAGLSPRTIIYLSSHLNQGMTEGGAKLLSANPDGIQSHGGKGCINIIGCMPREIFNRHSAAWQMCGFISRLLPFAYSYPEDVIIKIKNGIEQGSRESLKSSVEGLKKRPEKQKRIKCPIKIVNCIRQMADWRAENIMGTIGFRLLSYYHCLIRAHCLLRKGTIVNLADLRFLSKVDQHINPFMFKAVRLNAELPIGSKCALPDLQWEKTVTDINKDAARKRKKKSIEMAEA